MKTFKEKTVVLTGAASGIGRATSLAFARAGAFVHAVDVDEAGLADLKKELGDACAGTHRVDVREADALEELARAVYEQHGRVDILVNNAGVGHGGPVEKLSLEDWKWVLDVNLYGVIHGIQAFVPRLIAQGGGAHIVNTASVAGLMGVPHMAPYCASKFAVVGLSEALGGELRAHDIYVTAVCPGIINTPITSNARLTGGPGQIRESVKHYYATRGLPPERVARDILTAIRRRDPLKIVGGRAVVMLRNTSGRLYRRAASLLQDRVLGGTP